MEERFYYLGFSNFKGIGPVTFTKLLKQFGSAKDAWSASRSDLNNILGEKLLVEFEDFRNSFSFHKYQKRLEKNNVSFLTLQDKEYPFLLKQIKRPPFVLYVKGNEKFSIFNLQFSNSNSPRTLAVVGTRKITEYGREVTELFVSELVQDNFTIVSGLAMGVDAVAHKTTLDNNGKTIAVLGCGVDCCLPQENQHLYDQIIEKGGAIISEFPLGHPPSVGSFPARNRIVAGLSQGVLVTEGAEDSGSLITAGYAFSEGRLVFAVPGPITSSLSKGPFELIKKGGKLVTSVEDVIRELRITNQELRKEDKRGPTSSRSAGLRGASKEEKMILSLLENEAMHFDQIGRRTHIPSAKLGGILSVMEMKGMIKNTESVFSIVLT